MEILLITVVLVCSSMLIRAQVPPLNAPATFVFGDSLVDPGNNNYIPTIARSNFYPNGIDFPTGQPTGRFCNGRTVADVLAQLLNQPFLPPYLAPSTRGSAILQGVNYASAAAGILDGTGANYIGRISMNKQLEFFQDTQSEFQDLLTPSYAAQVFQKSIYFITIGSNDYINNYLLPESATRPFYTPQQYEDYLISELSRQLTLLYNMGARKICVFNVGPLGCIPSQLAQNNVQDGSCIDYINGYVQGFNRAAGILLNTLSGQLPGSMFVYGNAYDLVLEKVLQPANYGLINVNTGCCGFGKYNGQIPCVTGIKPCAERGAYLFWDPFHPTDAVNAQLATSFFSGPTSTISPVNIKQLAAMP
ncbi:unnamed protein product [Calypogeia fissa]